MSGLIRMLTVAAALLMPAAALAQADDLFPPETEGCYVGTEIAAAPGTKVLPYAKPAVPAAKVRIVRGYPQLIEEQRPRTPNRGEHGERLVNLQINVTFGDAGKSGPRRYVNGEYEMLACTADLCDAGNYKIERQSDGTVVLRMTGGMNIGGGPYLGSTERRLPDGHVYRLSPSPMAACR